MIGKVAARGGKVVGLLRYVYSQGPAQQEGRAGRNPHDNPRVIGGFDEPAELEPRVGPQGRRDFRRLAALLEQPLVAAGVGPDKKPVYHLIIAARKDSAGRLVDPYLDDGQWRDVAETYLDRLGFAGRGDDLGVRWVAVRHADDHVHVVATLARQDGARVHPRNDFYRIGEASRQLEAKYGLTGTAPADRTAAQRPTYAETAKAARRGQAEPARDTLRRSVRTAAAGAGSLPEFFGRLRSNGLLVRERMSERNVGQVTGYAVALPDATDTAGKPIFYGGGKLAVEFTVPKLRRRGEMAVPTSGSPAEPASAQGAQRTAAPAAGRQPRREGGAPDRYRLTEQERNRIWQQATAAAASAATAIAGDDLRQAADAAWAASDFLGAAARVVEGRRGGPLTAAAEQYDRAAREAWGRTPAPSQAGQGLRAAAALMTAARFVSRSETKQLLALLATLATLTDAVTRLRENQHRAAQATAARTASDGLRLRALQHTPQAAGGPVGAGSSRVDGRAGGYKERPPGLTPSGTSPTGRGRY